MRSFNANSFIRLIGNCRHQAQLPTTRLYSSASVGPQLPASSIPTPEYKGPSYETLENLRKTRLTPNHVHYYKRPLAIHSGKGQYLFDDKGKRYLDLFAGIVTVSVGHCHPKVNKALEEQMNTLWHTTNIYMHPKIHEYAEKLTATLPGDLKSVYFVNSGSEANDLAMFLARLYTGKFDLISLQNAYHGTSPYNVGLTAHSTWKFALPGTNNGIIHAMNADPYQGIWGGDHCRDSPVQTNRHCDCPPHRCYAGDNYYKQLENVFKYTLPRGKLAGMFAESIQGVGGTVQFPKGFIKKAAELVRSNGGVFISDEVQTGFGRTGEHFWGFQGHDLIPDIVTMAKGIGNGFPLAAVVTTPKIAEVLSQALHFNTFGGNPMASAVGIAVLDVIEEEKLQKNSLVVGTHFLKELDKLRDKHSVIGDVRGKGLMIGVELVEDRNTRQPMLPANFSEIWEDCREMGLLLGKGGLHGNVFRIKPPMCVTKEDIDFSVQVIDAAIERFTANRKKRQN